MKKNKALKIINPILLILLVNQAVTGLFGTQISHEMFTILHKGGGFVLVGLALVHLGLNFGWVKANFLRH